MSLRYGKKQIDAMIAALDADYETVKDAALAALGAAEAIFEERAQFVVVGQLQSTRSRTSIPASDPEAIKLSLGWYSTEGDAIKAAESLWHNAGSGDEFRTWVLPVHHGTPADLHANRKKAIQEATLKRKEKAGEKLDDDIRKRHEVLEERARGGKGSCETCSHQPYDHSTTGNGRGRCYVNGCTCPQWKEKTK